VGGQVQDVKRWIRKGPALVIRSRTCVMCKNKAGRAIQDDSGWFQVGLGSINRPRACATCQEGAHGIQLKMSERGFTSVPDYMRDLADTIFSFANKFLCRIG
jgi:hypothetical protein